jgi:hypothetical protein
MVLIIQLLGLVWFEVLFSSLNKKAHNSTSNKNKRRNKQKKKKVKKLGEEKGEEDHPSWPNSSVNLICCSKSAWFTVGLFLAIEFKKSF